MSLAANVFERPSQPITSSPAPHIGLVRRSRLVRDFVLLITVCLSIGIAVGLGMMIAVFALL